MGRKPRCLTALATRMNAKKTTTTTRCLLGSLPRCSTRSGAEAMIPGIFLVCRCLSSERPVDKPRQLLVDGGNYSWRAASGDWLRQFAFGTGHHHRGCRHGRLLVCPGDLHDNCGRRHGRILLCRMRAGRLSAFLWVLEHDRWRICVHHFELPVSSEPLRLRWHSH